MQEHDPSPLVVSLQTPRPLHGRNAVGPKSAISVKLISFICHC